MVTIFGHLSRAGMLTSSCLSRDKYNCCARDVSISISCSFDTGVFRRVSLFCYWLRADFTDFLSSSDIRDRVAALITASVGYRDIISSSILRSHFIRKLQDVFLFHRHYTRSTLTGNGKWWHYLASCRRQDPGLVRTTRQDFLRLKIPDQFVIDDRVTTQSGDDNRSQVRYSTIGTERLNRCDVISPVTRLHVGSW